MDRSNHYEAAFEAYLRASRLSYVAVDEARRTELDDEPIKSLDFIVSTRDARLLVDVKGRRFPGGPEDRPRRTWENWSTREDLDALARWEECFAGYLGLLVFVYHVLPVVDLPLGTPDQLFWRGRRYLIRAVPADEYRQAMRVRSPRWGTVHLSHTSFRELVRPFRDFVWSTEAACTAPLAIAAAGRG
jgi:hypothetical protein